jgi:tripartite-type tricarboxylate transporter receptor subunit TctC
MIKAGKLRPLAVLADAPLEIAGYDEKVPPITNWISDFTAAPIYFGIFVPKGVPDDVVETLNMIWEQKVQQSDKLREWAANNAVVFDPAYGETAVDKSFPMVQIDAWLKHEAGDTVMSPTEIGIPKP